MTRILLFFALTLSTSTLYAQVYPEKTDLEHYGLEGPIEKVVDITRSYSAALETWGPITVTRILNFNKDGNLLKRGMYISREQPDQQLFVYNAESDSIFPVLDATIAMFQSGESKPVEEALYAYEDDGRVAGKIKRDYQNNTVLKQQYYYKDKLLSGIVTRDSASNHITSIEFFHYLNDGKPTGSSTRHFNPKTDRVLTLADTARVPAERINHEYTFYTYTDTLTPVIYWQIVVGNDTVVDKQVIKRYLEDGMLSASTSQTLKDGKTTRTEALIFNKYTDVLSSAVSFGNDTTYNRALDYVYDELDNNNNWHIRRQYATVTPEDDSKEESSDEEKKILLSRTDREIVYRKR